MFIVFFGYLLPLNFFKFINSELNYNLYIIGESCDYFKGRVVPFYRSEYSWLVSTGLKGDIECHDMDIPSLKDSWKDYYKKVAKKKFDLDFYQISGAAKTIHCKKATRTF